MRDTKWLVLYCDYTLSLIYLWAVHSTFPHMKITNQANYYTLDLHLSVQSMFGIWYVTHVLCIQMYWVFPVFSPGPHVWLWLQAIDSIHQVGLYCLALVPANTLPKTPLGGIHISDAKQSFLDGSLHPCNILMCPHTCVTNLPKPRQKQPGRRNTPTTHTNAVELSSFYLDLTDLSCSLPLL